MDIHTISGRLGDGRGVGIEELEVEDHLSDRDAVLAGVLLSDGSQEAMWEEEG